MIEDVEIVGAGFRLSRATSYRYRDEGVRVLAAQAPTCTHDSSALTAATLRRTAAPQGVVKSRESIRGRYHNVHVGLRNRA